MKKYLFLGVMAVAMLVLAAGVTVTNQAQASSIKYSFIARGIITDVDEVNKTFKADVVKVDGKGKTDMESKNIEFKDGTAKVYKVVNAKDKHVTYHTLAVGQEVGIKGVADNNSDDTYTLSFIRIEDRSFSVVGLLQEHDVDAKTMKISVISSTYKPKNYKKGDVISMTYTDEAKFLLSAKEETNYDQVTANDQKVKVTGTITSTSTWEVKTLWAKYKANK